jgi:peroxiredoxin Q/BCP
MAKTKIAVGDKAPDFTLLDSYGNDVSLKSNRGSWIVLYFYPRDNTPGCTMEAISFTSFAPDFKKLNAQVIGISPDSCESHVKFILKHDLGITLLSDTEKKIMKQYGVWQMKTLYGKKGYGVVRSTFLIDPAGSVKYIWNKVLVEGHAEKVLETLKDIAVSLS